eukprot:1940306-Lingulodinium_polyedra.AAC.1
MVLERKAASVGIYRRLLAIASARWPLLPAEMRERYEVAATEEKEERHRGRNEVEEEALGALQVAVTRYQGQQQSGHSKPLYFSACSLDDRSIENWQMFFDSMEKSYHSVEKAMKKSMRQPDAPTEEHIRDLESMPVQDNKQR